MSFSQTSQLSALFPASQVRRRGRAASCDGQARGRVLRLEPLESRCLLSAVTGLGNSTGTGQSLTLADLPIAAQQTISSAIGQDQSAYHAETSTTGTTLANPANGFTAEVQSGALHVTAGSHTWDMALAGLGYGGAVQP